MEPPENSAPLNGAYTFRLHSAERAAQPTV